MKKLKYILTILFCLGIGFFLGVWSQKDRSIAQGVHCANNLSQIDSGRQLVAQRLGLKKGDPVPEFEIAKYCKDGVLPRCPAGGTYTINRIGYNPECSLDPKNSCMHRLMTGD
jgi:hypothetical protein